MSKLRERSRHRKRRRLWAFISAIGAVGGFFIPQAFGMSLNMTGSPVGAMKVFFNLLHRLCAADLAGLWSAEVQPKIRDRCLMYNRVASDKASRSQFILGAGVMS